MTADDAPRRPGRPRGPTGDTREALLSAAREAFVERGYDNATVRDIARRAGVDAAMIHHYFGSKEKLFFEAIDVPVDFARALASEDPVPRDRLGEHLVRAVLRAWDAVPSGVGLALARSTSGSPIAATMLRDVEYIRVIRSVARRVEADPARAEWRASLVAAELAGLVQIRYVIGVEPLASAPTEAVVAAVSGKVQHDLTGDVGGI